MGLVKATHQQRTELTADVTQRAYDSLQPTTFTTHGPNQIT